MKDGNLKTIDRYYERYEPKEKVIIEDTVIEYLFSFKNNLLEIEGSVPKELYSKLEIKK